MADANPFVTEELDLLLTSTSLLHLDLSNVENVTDDTLATIGKQCAQLRFVDLSCYSVPCQYTNDGLLRVLAACHDLQTICLTGCEFLEDSTLGSIVDHCPRLSSLVIQGCFRVSDAGVGHLLSDCEALTHLDISYCWGVTCHVFGCIGPTLKEFACSFCVQLEDMAAEKLTALGNPTSLEIIDVSSCKRLTDTFVQTLRDANLPRLHTLVVNGCHEISLSFKTEAGS